MCEYTYILQIRTPNVSNNLWIIFYFMVAIRSIVGCLYYGIHPFLFSLSSKTSETDKPSEFLKNYVNIKGISSMKIDAMSIEDMLFAMNILFHGMNCFLLCLSLNHQRRYRSSCK
jgi:hypothetical protein